MGGFERHWPLFDLRLRIDDIELRPPSDTDQAALADIAVAGIHPPDVMPFSTEWTDAPREELGRGTLQFLWACRAQWSVEAWDLVFAVERAGTVVGAQAVHSEDFIHRRSIRTGSWLGRNHQGRGTGKLMRTAVLAFAFDHLGALEARSGAFLDNPSSAAVSRALGYVEDGTETHAPRGRRAVEQRFVMTRDAWRARERPGVTVTGFAPCRAMFGLEDDS